jgi:hypothetical protein
MFTPGEGEVIPPYVPRIFDDIVPYDALEGSGNLLDLGCGTGELIVPLFCGKGTRGTPRSCEPCMQTWTRITN